MNLILSLRSEFVKTKHTSIWYLCMVASAVAPLYSFLNSGASYRMTEVQSDPWNYHFMGFGGLVLNMIILPFFLVLICTLAAQLEYRNNTWKQVYVSPQPLLHVFVSKYVVIQLLLIGVIVFSCLLMVVSLYAVHYFKFDTGLSRHRLDWNRFFSFWTRIYVTVLAISAFQFWMGLRFKNFIVPIVIGICLLLGGAIMMEEYPWVYDGMYPYLYPMRNYFPKYPAERTTMVLGSLAYTALFLVLGFIDFRRTRNAA